MKKHILSTILSLSLLSAWSNPGERPVVYAVADAHLDTQWNWDVQKTIRSYLWNTINQNLFLLSQYPDYIFNFEGGVKYSWMKEYYPREYELMKKYIADGRWHISGASWDANDVNVPSVESQIRNIMLGQNFYRNEFGVESTDIFLPDCFGFGWTLPTIASHCGLIGFSSQKLDWRINPFYGENKHPFTVGLWQGVDGERIMLAHGYSYGKRWPNIDLSSDSTLLSLSDRSPLNIVYRYYGTGDIGGSPTIGSVESVVKGVNGAGPLVIKSSASDRMFKDFLPYESHPELPVFDGELLMDVHGTGCYTSQAAMKLYNRQNEQLGDAAERAAVIATMLAGVPYPSQSFTESWRRFIWHQFHDDLTGTSIPRAYEFSWNDELLSLKQFAGLLTDATANVAATMNTNVKGVPVILYNPLGYEVSDLVEISVPAKFLPAKAAVKNHLGQTVPAQITGFDGSNATLLVSATVPPVGYAVYDVALSGRGALHTEKPTATVENSVYRLTFDGNGDITSIIDKRSNRELVKNGRSIRLALFADNPSYSWPAWEIMKKTIDAEPVSITDGARVTLVEDGSVRKTVKVSKKYGDSEFTQYIRLYEGELAPRIDFDNEIDWATANALVKAEFPLTASNQNATYDLGIGVAQRGNNTLTAYEVPAQQWADLTDASGNYGVTVLNNSKYGWDKPDNNTLRLTLLHTPKTRKNYSYHDRQDLGHHRFTYSIIGHNGKLDRAAAAIEGEKLNQPVKAFVATKHKGESRCLSFAHTDAPNVVIKALKGAEDGNGYVVRVYETAGKPTKANILFAHGLESAYEADGTEKALASTAFSGNTLPVNLKANGIATYRVRFNEPKPTMARMHTVALPMNKKAMTWNEFRHNGDFSGGYTYAAEIVPEQLVSGGISFTLYPKSEKNALACKGDTLLLPVGTWNKLHILAAAATDDADMEAKFNIGGKTSTVTVPSYTGFIGQWGHTGHTEGYLKEQRVAFTGTHRHSADNDEPYEYTYMYHYSLDVPQGATSVILPDNSDIVLFAATVSEGDAPAVVPAVKLFRTANRHHATANAEAVSPLKNVLTPAMITAWSDYVVESERPEFLVDGDENTKWCDIAGLPSTVDFDLGVEKQLKGWRVVNAANENPAYVTSTCFLLGRNSPTEEWRRIDMFGGNRQNVVKRLFNEPQAARYLRLMVTAPTQDPTGRDTRIYELEVFE